MVGVLALGAVIWGLGGILGQSRRRRLVVLGLLALGVLAAQMLLPEGHGLREATGAEPQAWGALAVVAGVAAAYGLLLARLRRRARGLSPAPSVRGADAGTATAGATPGGGAGSFAPEELERYARHIFLREIGGPGQKRLRGARVLVVGAGGLGAPAVLYLAAAGVGTIGIIDDDLVDLSNLQRQVIHSTARIGQPKVRSAASAVADLNPHVRIRPYQRRLTEDIAATLFAEYDLVLDGTDNFDTRYLVNRTAAGLGIPLIAAAIGQWEGQVGLYDPARGGACFECVFPNRPAPGLVPSCAEAGVAAPLPGIIGAMMAMEAVKVITGAGQDLRGRLVIHDALHAETRVIATRPRRDCAACGGLTPGSPGG